MSPDSQGSQEEDLMSFPDEGEVAPAVGVEVEVHATVADEKEKKEEEGDAANLASTESTATLETQDSGVITDGRKLAAKERREAAERNLKG